MSNNELDLMLASWEHRLHSKCKVHEQNGKPCERGPVTTCIPGIGLVCSYHGRNHKEYRISKQGNERKALGSSEKPEHFATVLP